MRTLDDLHYKDLYFRDNRVKKYIRLLSDLRYPQTHPLVGWKHILGDFNGPQAADFDDGDWRTFAEFDFFGQEDEYGWFRRRVEIPAEMAGLRVALNIKSTINGTDDTVLENKWNDANPGFLCYVDGVLSGHYDRFHRSIVLTEAAEAGRVYTIALKYWTEEARPDYFCPLLRVIDARVETLFYDFKLAYDWAVQRNYQEGERMRIVAPLSEAASMLDLRTPYNNAFYDSIEKAHAYLSGFYNKEWVPYAEPFTVECVGHSHIDIAWMWRIRQSREKALRTFLNALHYIEADPHFTFFSSQPLLYEFIKQDYPDVYERIKAAIQTGRWEADGGMYVEADCNLTGGEGFVRQFLYGTRFYKQEFGIDCTMLWLPDVFGYSAALPQILRQFGLSYFTTSKISGNEYNCMPHDTFVWQGIDGSEVFTHLLTGHRLEDVKKGDYKTAYNTELSPAYINGAWLRYHDKELTDSVFQPVGWGDGGGGVTDYMVEYGSRLQNGLPGSVKAAWGHVGEWFRRWSAQLKDNRFLSKWCGELYFEYHRGTLTSMGRMKKKNRESEFLYQKIEWLSLLDAHFHNAPYPKAQLDEGWKLILTNQFHDILPGSSIKPVYEDADAFYDRSFAIGHAVEAAARASLVSGIAGAAGDIVVFNPAGFARCDLAAAETEAAAVSGALSQRGADGRLYFLAEVPAKGYAVFSPGGEPATGTTVSFADNVIDTPHHRITLDADGFFSSVYDKQNAREVLLPGTRGNLLRAYEDRPLHNDAWDINVFYREKYTDVTELVSCALVENGPLYAVLRQVRRFNRSLITQDIVFYAHNARIDFRTTADWHERFILLKAHFPIHVNATTATYEIQFGAITRNTHENTSWDFAKFEVCGHKWGDISEQRYGAAVLNDCKYGYSAQGTDLALSLIKCAAGPNVDCDREVHHFTYAFYPHAGNLTQSDVHIQGLRLNLPLEAAVKPASGGALPAAYSFVRDTEGSVVIDTVKRAEDSGAAVVRLYEPLGRRTRTRILFGSKPQLVQTANLAETPDTVLTPDADGAYPLAFGAFEIKTLLVTL